MNAKKINRLRKRKAIILKRKIMMSAFVVTLAFVGSIRFCGVLSSAHENSKEEETSFKYYKSIRIEQGDTLWGIAEQYMSDDYHSIQEYIDEVKRINHLTSDEIYDYGYLMIAYYDTEYKI